MTELEKKREVLRNSLKGNLTHDLPIREEIHFLTMKIEGVEVKGCSLDDDDCLSCGA